MVVVKNLRTKKNKRKMIDTPIVDPFDTLFSDVIAHDDKVGELAILFDRKHSHDTVAAEYPVGDDALHSGHQNIGKILPGVFVFFVKLVSFPSNGGVDGEPAFQNVPSECVDCVADVRVVGV